jgi:hypothetical protein
MMQRKGASAAEMWLSNPRPRLSQRGVFLHRRITLDLREAGFIYRDLGQMRLRIGVMSLHPGKCPFHLCEHPNCIRGQIRIAIAFMPRDQTKLTLNPKTLVENLLFPNLDGFLGRDSSVGHAIETPAQPKGSRLRRKRRL